MSRSAVGGKRAGALTELPVPGPTAALPGPHWAYKTASGCHVIVGHEPAAAAPYYGPRSQVECARGHVDGDCFPGTVREWEDEP